MQIVRLINTYRTSNTYIVDVGEVDVIIIDVGGPNIDQLLGWIKENDKRVTAVFLTHEHADHCLGVNSLFAHLPFTLYCSGACAANIRNSRQNFSFYTDEISTFEVNVPATIVRSMHEVSINNMSLLAIETPGHSPGSMCYKIGNAFFSGDTLLNNTKTPLTFPHSNREQYKQSLNTLSSIIEVGTIIYPGHGFPFEFIENEINTLAK